ncbi:MAG TPA: TIM barrel protein [Pirellulales bacterium]|nr:TIM barrel protein [Pirellulales bacterium]
MFKSLDVKALGLSPTQSETIELALSFGFRSVDLDLVEFAAEVAAYGLPRARRLLDSAKLKVGTVMLPPDWQREKDFKAAQTKLNELCGLAALLGARRALTIIDPASDERPYHENFAFYGQRLGELGRALEPHGLKVGVGFESSSAARQGKQFEFVHDFEALLVLLSTAGAANVGLWLDVWQIWASGGSLDEARKKLRRGQVVAVSLSDAAETDDADRYEAESRRLPGETGLIDSAAVLTSLAEIGYDGPVTPAPGRKLISSMRRDQLVKRLGEKLDAAWKAAGIGPTGKLAASASH